jgi:UDP-glucuronate 4-epimerase
MSKKILITGVAGFIGSNLASSLLMDSENIIVGIDNLNAYYDPELKKSRLVNLVNQFSNKTIVSVDSDFNFHNFNFHKINLEEKSELEILFKEHCFDMVINLAAQAGVRYSIDYPDTYIKSNIVGFYNILELCRHYDVKKLVYASSSSVYGDNSSGKGFVENLNVDKPISLYASTKKTNELMAHTYSHLFNIKTVGLRFFTVYGPWGRPDMAYYSFTKKILNGAQIDLYNFGNQNRDFTYIDDVIRGIVSVLNNIDTIKNNYNIYNLGNSHPETLFEFVKILEKNIGLKANLNLIAKQPGDVAETFADSTKLFKATGFKPTISLTEGLNKFIDWYLTYYNHSKIDNSCAE